jgi:hypothetical protein
LKKLLRTVALLAIAGNVCAIEPPPVLLIVHKDVGATTDGTAGLLVLGIGTWANHFVNKKSAVKVARFHSALGGMDLLAEASHVFGCVGAEKDCGRTAFTDAAQFEAALTARADKAGVVVEVPPELVADQMLMRSVSHAVVLSSKKTGKDKKPRIEQGDTYIALFTTRPPDELAALKETDAAKLAQYWTEGEPRRLVSEARHGLIELNSLLAALVQAGGKPGKMPEVWQGLPKAKELKESGRLGCGMIGNCRGLFVLEDNGDSVVLVCCGNAAGWFDAAAARKQAGVSFMAVFGLPQE